MSPAEYIGLITSIQVDRHVMNFVAVLFAYLVTAYFVGSKLSPFQVRAVTLLYTIFSAFPVLAVVFSMNQMVRLMEQFRLEHPSLGSTYYPQTSILNYWTPILVLILTLAWALSVWFMVRVRRSKLAHEKTD
jgi:hypothetical protein